MKISVYSFTQVASRQWLTSVPFNIMKTESIFQNGVRSSTTIKKV